MAEIKTYLKIAGKSTLQTLPLVQHAREFGAPTDFWGRANSFYLPRGMHSGYGWAVMRREDAETILQTENAEWKWTFGSFVLRINAVPVRAEKQNFSDTKKPENDFFLVEFGDERYKLLRGPIIEKQYNLIDPFCPADSDAVSPSEFNYLSASLNEGAQWTWQEIIDDLWPAGATAPTIPTTPLADPCGYRFAGITAWEAVHLVLQDAGMTTVLDPINDRWRIAELGGVETSWGEESFTNFVEDNRKKIAFEKETLTNVNFLPPYVQPHVLLPMAGWPEQFAPHGENYDYDQGLVGTSGEALGDPKYYQPVWGNCEVFRADGCTVGAIVDHSGIDSQVDMLGDAEARRMLGFRNGEETTDSQRILFAGILGSSSPDGDEGETSYSVKLPGEIVDSVTWKDYGDSRGPNTEYAVRPIARIYNSAGRHWHHTMPKEPISVTVTSEQIDCDMTGEASRENCGGTITICNKSCRKLLIGDEVIAYPLCESCEDSGSETVEWHVYHVNRVLMVKATSSSTSCCAGTNIDVQEVMAMDCSCVDQDLSAHTYFRNSSGQSVPEGVVVFGIWDEEFCEYQLITTKGTLRNVIISATGSSNSDPCATGGFTLRSVQACIPVCDDGEGEGTPGYSFDGFPNLELKRTAIQYVRAGDDTGDASGSGSGSGTIGDCKLECAWDIQYFLGLSDEAVEECDSSNSQDSASGSDACEDELPDDLTYHTLWQFTRVSGVLVDVVDAGDCSIDGVAVDIWVPCVNDEYTVDLIEMTECEPTSGSGS